MEEFVTMSIRVEKGIKDASNKIFESIGLNMTSAINTFLRRVILENGIPYALSLNIPNKETIDAILEGERIARDPNTKKYNNFREILEEIKNEPDNL